MKEKEPEQKAQEHSNNGPEQAETMQSDSQMNNDDDKTTELQQELEEAKKKFLYLFSDFENFKRNTAKERMELISTAGREILTALLPILDDFDRAQKNDALTEGTTLIHHKLVNLARAKGLLMFETKVGDDFNADRHEAIAEIPAPSAELKGKIVDVTEQGYTLGDRIIRYAKVIVGK